MEPKELFEKASAWTAEKAENVSDLGGSTPCDEWTMKELMNHAMGGMAAVGAAARGEDAPDVLEKDYTASTDYAKLRATTIDAIKDLHVTQDSKLQLPFGEMPAQMALTLMGTDQLIHGWDMAKATGQDTAMPEEVAEASMAFLTENMPNFSRGDFFKESIEMPEDASLTNKLIALSGRQP